MSSDSAWAEYDEAAEWCAKRGSKGKAGDRLPCMISSEVVALINADPEAFEQRVRGCAYAMAMNKREASEWDGSYDRGGRTRTSLDLGLNYSQWNGFED